MPQVFAGFICGYGVALVSTPLLALMLLRLRAAATPESSLGRLLPPNLSVTSLGVLLHTGLFFFWTAVGMLLGLVLLAMRGAGSALGSDNGAFSLFVAAVMLALFAPVAALVRVWRWQIVACALAVVVAFGWVMPHLARLAQEH